MKPVSNNYTAQQSAQIREAIRQGRAALARGTTPSSQLFASAFLRAGGLQYPGGDLDQATRRRMEGCIMAIVNRRWRGAPEPEPLQRMIDREVARIEDEYGRFQAMLQADLTGYRLVPPDGPVADRACCERFAALDLYGLGAGVVPPHEIVVLPPCCDGARWEPVHAPA